MTVRAVLHPKFVMRAAVIILAVAVLRTPTAQSVIVGGLVECAEMTERVLQFPYWFFDHTHCFSLDRFDPTCPQCL